MSTALAPRFPGLSWQRYIRPEEAGFSAAGLAAVDAYVKQTGAAAVLLLRQGAVVGAWGQTARRFRCHALRECLLHATLGLAVGDGRLDPQATLAQLGIDEVPPLPAPLRQARLTDLMTARSGIYRPAAYEATRPLPRLANHPPGSHFHHNSWNINALATAFHKATGDDLFTAFGARLATPLGMEDFRLFDGYYRRDPARSLHPAFPCRLSARDLARLGLLYLRQGRWHERQLLPTDWIANSTRPHVRLDAGVGYGQLWWTYCEEDGDPRLEGGFAARSPGGQALEILPALDLVLVHRADSYKGARIGRDQRRQLLDHILEAHEGSASEHPALEALPANAQEPSVALKDPARFVGTFPFEDDGGHGHIAWYPHEAAAADQQTAQATSPSTDAHSTGPPSAPGDLMLLQPTGECFRLLPRTAAEFFVEDAQLSLFVRCDANGQPQSLGWGPDEVAPDPVELRDERMVAGQWQGDLVTLAEESFQVTALLEQNRHQDARALVQSRPPEEQAALVTLAERPEEVLSLTAMDAHGKPAYRTAVVDRLPTDLVGHLAAPTELKYGRYNAEIIRAMSPPAFGRVVGESIDPVDQPELRVQVLLDWFRAVRSMDDVDKAAQLLQRVDKDVLEEALAELMTTADLGRNMAPPSSAFGVSLKEALAQGATQGDPGRFFDDEHVAGIMSILYEAAPDLLTEVLGSALRRVEWGR